MFKQIYQFTRIKTTDILDAKITETYMIHLTLNSFFTINTLLKGHEKKILSEKIKVSVDKIIVWKVMENFEEHVCHAPIPVTT